RLTVTDDRGRTAEMSQAVELMWDPPQPPELPPEGWPAPVRPADPPLPSGSHTAPSMPSLTTRSDGDGAEWPVVEWTGPAEVERYRIEFRHRGSGGCDIRHARVIDAVENPQHV